MALATALTVKVMLTEARLTSYINQILHLPIDCTWNDCTQSCSIDGNSRKGNSSQWNTRWIRKYQLGWEGSTSYWNFKLKICWENIQCDNLNLSLRSVSGNGRMAGSVSNNSSISCNWLVLESEKSLWNYTKSSNSYLSICNCLMFKSSALRFCPVENLGIWSNLIIGDSFRSSIKCCR